MFKCEDVAIWNFFWACYIHYCC